MGQLFSLFETSLQGSYCRWASFVPSLPKFYQEVGILCCSCLQMTVTAQLTGSDGIGPAQLSRISTVLPPHAGLEECSSDSLASYCSVQDTPWCTQSRTRPKGGDSTRRSVSRPHGCFISPLPSGISFFLALLIHPAASSAKTLLHRPRCAVDTSNGG